MSRTISWVLAWLLALVWCLGVRPFIPASLPIEPCLPLLVASLMLGPLRVIVPLIMVGGLLIDAFQPFPQPLAFFFFLVFSALVGLSVRFILARRSYYSALILVIVSRLLLAGVLYALGPGAALWPADRAVVLNPLFLFVTTLADAFLLLITFRVVARPLLGVKRVEIAR